MISDDTLMGTSLMTFSVQGTGWFGLGNFTAVKQKGPGHPVCSSHQGLFLWCLKSLCIAVKVKKHQAMKQILPTTPKPDKANTQRALVQN